MASYRSDDPYYLSRGGQQYGPYTWEALCELGINGNLYPGDQIWSESLGTWTSIETIPELKQYITTVQTGRPKWLIPATLTLFGLAIILVAAVLFRQTTRLTVKEYYPKSGPAGSCVLLEISKSVEPEHVKILCGDHNLAFSYLGDNCYSVILPTDPSSNQIRLLYKDKEADSVSFAVLQPEITLLHEEKLRPSPTGQRIESKAGISVTLPGEFLDKQRYLTISRVTNPAVPRQDPFHDLEYIDITIDGLSQLKDYIEIGIPYDPSLIDPSIPLEANFDPAYWNEEEQKWIDVYYRVDPDSHKVYFITDHLCVSVIGLGTAAITVGVASEIGERLLNDKYISRDKKVRILYSDAGLQQLFPNKKWEARIAPAKLHTGNWYNPKISSAVQDFGHILDISLARYMREGFADPTVKTVWGKHVYNRYVKVKVDSWYNAGGEMSHDTFWDQINVPSYLINTYFYDENMTARDTFEDRFTRLKAFLSHELFHVFQRPYYSITIALIQTPHLWWREACAEWASHDLAKIPDRPGWYKDAPYISDRISYNYLKYPLSTIGNQTGTVVGNGLEYQYVTAIFLRFLVREKGFNIKELTERVALDSGADPLRPLRKYVRRQTGKSFDEVYAEFANWLLKTTGLKLFDKIDLKSNAVVAERTVPVFVPDKETTVRVYQLCAENKDPQRISVYKLPGDREHLTQNETPAARLDDCFPETAEIEVSHGDYLAVVISNGTEWPQKSGLTIQARPEEKWENIFYETVETKPDGTTKVLVFKVSSEAIFIDPSKIENAIHGEEYTFKVKVAGLPEQQKEAELDYDFGDRQKDSTGKITVSLNRGEGTFTLKHTFKPVPNVNKSREPTKYTLTVQMKRKDEKPLTGKSEIFLAPVELVVTPRHSVGPPGATFDLEAYARPEAVYKYKWEMEGEAEAFEDQGKTSGIAPALEKEGEFFITVKLFDLEGTLLTTDRVTVMITKADEPEEGKGYWKLAQVEKIEKNIRAMKESDPSLYNNAKSYCDENFSSSVAIERGKLKIDYTGKIQKSRGGETEEIDFTATWTDPGETIHPGRKTIKLSAKEMGKSQFQQRNDVNIDARISFSTGDEGDLAGGISQGIGMFSSPHYGWNCQTRVHLAGRGPLNDSCTITPTIPDGEEGRKLAFVVKTDSKMGTGQLTMIYDWVDTQEKEPEPETPGYWELTRIWQETWEDDFNNKDKVPINLSGNSFTYSRVFQDLTNAFHFDYAGSWEQMPKTVPHDTVMETTLRIDSIKMTYADSSGGACAQLNSGWDRFKNKTDTPKPDWISHGWSFEGVCAGGKDKDFPKSKIIKWSLKLWPEDGAKQVVTVRAMAYSVRSSSVAHTYYEYTFRKDPNWKW
ncbi:MAG TPA: DUF4339 domain-containing protein [Thermoanaerobaculia bacterium]|nr:DUF4339 domain-containing protein [Thermoanaerobaculia bacterium]